MDTEQAAINSYLKVFGWVLLGVALLPFDFYGDDPLWPWLGLLDGGWADILAVLLPALGGLFFLSLIRLRRNKLVAAWLVMTSLGVAWVVNWWSTLVPHPLGVYDHLTAGLPPLFSRSFWLLLAGIALLGAGVRLGAKGFLEPHEGRPSLADPWQPARAVTLGGIILIVLFYLLPYRGSVPIYSLLVGVIELGGHLDQATAVALLAGQVLSLGPLLFALTSVVRLWRRAPEHGGTLVGLLLAFIPVLCVLVGLRSIAFDAAYTLLHIRSAALILTVTVGASLSLSILIRGIWYQVPWTFGQLTAVDRMLAAALSKEDPRAALRESCQPISSLVRPFIGRRLRLWKSAAAQVPDAGEADLSMVMQFIQRRRREEEALDGDVEQSPAAWPAWMLGGRPVALIVVGLCALASMTWLAARRPRTLADWIVRQDSPEMGLVFTDRITAAISDLSYHRGGSAGLESISELSRTLLQVEPQCPGIHDSVMDLLSLGELGRNRLHSIWRARDRLNYLLQENGVPYFVRSRVRARRGVAGQDLFYLLTPRVIECRRYRQAGRDLDFPVLKLSRADRLNVIERYVATTDEEEPCVSILLNRVDEFLNERLRVVAGQPDPVGDVVRAGMEAAGLGADDFAAGVEGRLGEWIIEGLTRHELHHKWLGLDPDPPAALWAWMSGYSEDSVRGVASEVGAFLGELGFQPAYARMRLALMIEAVNSHSGHRGTHGRAKVFLLAKLFEVALDGPLAWQIQGVRLAVPLLQVMSDDDLSRRIGKCHRELFGAPLPGFEPVDNT